ncbi:DNA mismatch repair endonuclease MutL [Candidatus Karelsulcia muelleri]
MFSTNAFKIGGELFMKRFPTEYSKQISAGYVIQRPASVVKELLEHSIYAQAKNIQLILLNGGKDLINVIDDGEGMNPSAPRSLFSTSKLSSSKYLKSLNTKGLRWEALSYISLVSKVEIYTKNKNSEFGAFLTLENQKLKYPPVFLNNLLNCTRIYVKNLFYNFPKRKTFLQSAHLELKSIISEFHHIVLSHPEINFVLRHKNKILTRLKPTDLKARIIQLFGDSYKKVLIKVFKKDKLFAIKGYITSPSFLNTQFKNYYLFVNNIYIGNQRIHRSILRAYQGIISKSNKPNYFLFLTIPQNQISICQSKILIKSEAAICKNINRIIKEYLGIQNVFKFYYKEEQIKNKEENTRENLQELINNLDLNQCPSKIYKKYILFLLDFGILIINKSRAYQIIIEDKFKKELKTTNKLYPPINIKFKNSLKERNILESLNKFGFKINLFEKSLSIISSPKFLTTINVYRLLSDLLSQNNQIIEKFIYKKIYKFYQLETKKQMDSLEISNLIKKILKISNLLEKPIWFFLDINKIDRSFF